MEIILMLPESFQVEVNLRIICPIGNKGSLFGWTMVVVDDGREGGLSWYNNLDWCAALKKSRH